jgi:hypothetical protein
MISNAGKKCRPNYGEYNPKTSLRGVVSGTCYAFLAIFSHHLTLSEPIMETGIINRCDNSRDTGQETQYSTVLYCTTVGTMKTRMSLTGSYCHGPPEPLHTNSIVWFGFWYLATAQSIKPLSR